MWLQHPAQCLGKITAHRYLSNESMNSMFYTLKINQCNSPHPQTKEEKPHDHLSEFGKSTWQNSASSYDKKTQQTRNWRELSQLDKQPVQKCTASNALNGKRLSAFPLRSRKKMDVCCHHFCWVSPWRSWPEIGRTDRTGTDRKKMADWKSRDSAVPICRWQDCRNSQRIYLKLLE